MFDKWYLNLIISIIFFVFGQIILKLDDGNLILKTSSFFIIGGILGLILLIWNNKNDLKNIKLSKMGIIAGILFFLGNYLWIKVISSNESLGIVRITMSGLETLLLFLLGFIIFKEKITIKKIIGSMIVLFGLLVSQV